MADVRACLLLRLGKAMPFDTESALWEQIEEQLKLQGNVVGSAGTVLAQSSTCACLCVL